MLNANVVISHPSPLSCGTPQLQDLWSRIGTNVGRLSDAQLSMQMIGFALKRSAAGTIAFPRPFEIALGICEIEALTRCGSRKRKEIGDVSMHFTCFTLCLGIHLV